MDGDCARAGDERRLGTARGFVLSEILIAVAIFVLMSGAAMTVYVMSLRTWYEGSAQVALQRKLVAAMQRMVRGGRSIAEDRLHGLREAQDVTVIDPHTIEFTSGVDGAKRRFYLDGNELVYGPDGSKVYDPSRSQPSWDTSTFRTDVLFTQLPDGTIEIRLVGEERVKDGWMQASLVTRVAPRNQEYRLDDDGG